MRFHRTPFPASALPCVCPTCGGDFAISPSDLADQNFCSRPCYWRWHSVDRPCPWCATVVHSTMSRAQRGHGHFCDTVCYQQWRAKRARERLAERFWSHVTCIIDTRCWEWQASRLPNGYGQLSVVGVDRPLRAPRVAWELEHGSIDEGLFVCHRCDNPPCVNPSHLFLGSARENTHDMLTKGRVWKGNTKLSPEQVADARTRYRFRKVTTVMLAAEFGSSKEAVRRAIKGIRYQ